MQESWAFLGVDGSTHSAELAFKTVVIVSTDLLSLLFNADLLSSLAASCFLVESCDLKIFGCCDGSVVNQQG